MIVDTITELHIFGVYDRGLPNQERIVIRVEDNINLGQFGIMVGIRLGEGSAYPIKDNLLWFGDAYVGKDDWIFIYTGAGEPKATKIPNTQNNLYSVHWGRKETILHTENLVPMLFRVDAVQVPQAYISLPKQET